MADSNTGEKSAGKVVTCNILYFSQLLCPRVIPSHTVTHNTAINLGLVAKG